MKKLLVGLLLAASMAACPARAACTTELGIRIEPRETTVKVDQRVRVTVEISSCGGSKKGTPQYLSWTSTNPQVAVVDATKREIVGISPGETTIQLADSQLGRIGTVHVSVVDR